jgi:hypothetical protein
LDAPVEEANGEIISSAPVLFVRDVGASAEHYRDTMGFRFDCFLGRDGLHVMLKSASDYSAIIPRWNISPNLWDMYSWVDDVEELYREFQG